MTYRDEDLAEEKEVFGIAHALLDEGAIDSETGTAFQSHLILFTSEGVKHTALMDARRKRGKGGE